MSQVSITELQQTLLLCAKEVLTLKEAAVWCGLSVRTLRDRYTEMGITPSKRGQTLYFRKMELERWMTSGDKPAKAEAHEIASEIINNFNQRRRPR